MNQNAPLPIPGNPRGRMPPHNPYAGGGPLILDDREVNSWPSVAAPLPEIMFPVMEDLDELPIEIAHITVEILVDVVLVIRALPGQDDHR